MHALLYRVQYERFPRFNWHFAPWFSIWITTCLNLKMVPTQLDRGIVETNFWYRTWNFQYLCIFSSSIQWCGSNIDFLLCQYNKNEKKNKLPGNNSWKVLIWHFILYKWLYPRKIQFATLSKHFFQRFLTDRSSLIFSFKNMAFLMFSWFFTKNFSPKCCNCFSFNVVWRVFAFD